jgi:hypothetical protein
MIQCAQLFIKRSIASQNDRLRHGIEGRSRIGCLDQLHPDGHVAVGSFKIGVFIEV